MLQLKSILNVSDNSGALLVECIKVLKSKKYASIGDEITVAVKKIRPPTDQKKGSATASKIKKGDVCRAVVIRTRQPVSRLTGHQVRFDDNACVLINYQKQPLGTRITGLVGADLFRKDWLKVLALAKRVV